MRFNQKWMHSGTNTRPTYITWRDMRGRCHNPDHPRFKDYGGRGIFVCERWRDDFDTFFEDMGFKPEGYSIERINNNQGYDPLNCQWIPLKLQAKNRRSTGKTHGTISCYNVGKCRCELCRAAKATKTKRLKIKREKRDG